MELESWTGVMWTNSCSVEKFTATATGCWHSKIKVVGVGWCGGYNIDLRVA